MRCERICGLGRHLSNLNKDCSDTFAAQWFERTLDDSAIRRIDLPHLFLTADAILITLDNVASGLVVYPARVHSRLMEELPFMVSFMFIIIYCLLLCELRAPESVSGAGMFFFRKFGS